MPPQLDPPWESSGEQVAAGKLDGGMWSWQFGPVGELYDSRSWSILARSDGPFQSIGIRYATK